MVIYIKELDVLRIIFLKKEMIIRGYRDMLYENTWNVTDLRFRDFFANNMRSAGGSAKMRR
jgi:hypothetical protein